MSRDNQADFRPEQKKDRSTKDLARPWLVELASREKPSRATPVPSKKQNEEAFEPSRTRRAKIPPVAAKPPASPPPRQRYKPRLGKKPNDRGWWIWGFIFGFSVGLAMSLTYGWVLDPHPQPVGPAELTLIDQEVYMRLVAAAFFHNENENQARLRLAKLQNPKVQMTLIDLTERYIDQGRDIRDVRSLVTLAGIFGQPSPKMAVFLSTPTPLPTATDTPAATPTSSPTETPTPLKPTPTATLIETTVIATAPLTTTFVVSSTVVATLSSTSTLTPTATSTDEPTPTPTATSTSTPTATATATPTTAPSPTLTPLPTDTATPRPNVAYGLAESNIACDSANGGLLKIYIRDRLGVGVPGVEISLSWLGGRDNLFTGFKPEIDPGYADFQMDPGETYQIELVNLETTGQVPEITINDRELCPNLPADVDPSWQVVFQQGAN